MTNLVRIATRSEVPYRAPTSAAVENLELVIVRPRLAVDEASQRLERFLRAGSYGGIRA